MCGCVCEPRLLADTLLLYPCPSLPAGNTHMFTSLPYLPICIPGCQFSLLFPPSLPPSNTARRFRTWLGGWALVLGSLLFLSFFLYIIVLAKLLPIPSPSFELAGRRRWTDLVREDEYFCLLVPLTLAPATVLGYLNWVAMEFYRAN